MSATGPTWRELVAGSIGRIEAEDARRIGEEVSGWEGVDWTVHLDDVAGALGHSRFEAMVERRRSGEPLQYVLGRWGFRRLDLFVDRRVLIPRPETEWVVESALGEFDRVVGGGGPAVVVDLGTGSGAIALAVADERGPGVRVIATDASAEALAVARANLAGLGSRGTVVELHEGDWFDALPVELRGGIGVVVANPPYIAKDETLPSEVADWEPRHALVPGERGLEAIEAIVAGAPAWLAPGGALVCEIGETQAQAVWSLSEAAGFAETEIRPDLAGRDRIVVARL